MISGKRFPVWFSIVFLAVAIFVVVPAQAKNTFSTLVETEYGKLNGQLVWLCRPNTLRQNGGPGEIWTLDLSVISRTL